MAGSFLPGAKPGHQVVAGCLYEMALVNRMPIFQYQGAYWHQMLENCLEDTIEGGFEWVITHDYDTTFGPHHVKRLFDCFEANPFMDALAPMQVMRNNAMALVGVGDAGAIRVQRDMPFKAKTAHFGLTVIRLAALKNLPKPWFQGVPNLDKKWRDYRIDPDIYFWKQWDENGRTLFIDPMCRVGHLEEMIAYYDERMQVQRTTPVKWREMNGEKASEA